MKSASHQKKRKLERSQEEKQLEQVQPPHCNRTEIPDEMLLEIILRLDLIIF